MMERSALLEPFDRMIAGLFPPERVRQGDDWDAERAEIEESGFLDLLADGQLTLAHAVPLFMALGRHAAPLGIGAAMIARGGLGGDARTIMLAAAVAGAGEHVLAMSVAHANERVQFGKAIGRQQAVQQNLAVMAEHVVAMRMAAELAAADFPQEAALKAATAAATAAALAAPVAAAAHAVHGAIGISAEHDLQLYTRRLHRWRAELGGAQAPARALGAAVLAGEGGSIDWVRTHLFCEE